MRILFTIAHYYKATEGFARHASLRANPQPRIEALSTSIASLHQLYSKPQYILNHAKRVASIANEPQKIDIVICTTQGHHLVDRLPLAPDLYTHHPTQVEPLLLGFECQAVLRDRLGQYDYYCYLEDDLILHDPWFFIKLQWLNQHVGDANLLQPNRYEISTHPVQKVYIDGDTRPQATAPFQDIGKDSQLLGKVMNLSVRFQRPLNPHSGCYFLNANQMIFWAKQPYFLDRDTRFIGPLESAATLGIMRAFKIYKPTPDRADFLEIQHYGNGFLSLIGDRVKKEEAIAENA